MIDYKPKNILITGGAGFIGSHFIRFLLKSHKSIQLINVDMLTYAASLNNLKAIEEDARYHFIKGDICNQHLIEELFTSFNIDTVVHFAAESHVDRSISTPMNFIHSNITGTFTLLEIAKNYWQAKNNLNPEQCRFHHVSTDEVYGSLKNEDLPFTESSAYAPNSPYSATKAGSDHLVRAYAHTYGLPITLSNCSNNYGANQHAEKLIPTVINSCLQEQTIPIYGTGENIRDWLYVVDHCTAIDLILRKGKVNETYNIGGNNEKTNLEIVNTICALLNEINPSKKSYNSLIRFVKDRPGHDWRYAIDNKKIVHELNWQPTANFHHALSQTVQWYIQNTWIFNNAQIG